MSKGSSKSGQKQSGKGAGKVVTTDMQGGGAAPAGGTVGSMPDAQGKPQKGAGSTKKA